jgi:zinc protease
MITDRAVKPIPTDEIKFSLPQINGFELENGLRVLFIQKDNLPIIQLNLVSECGSKYDPKDKKGLANLFSMLLDEGAGDFNALELSDEFELLGANFNVSCGSDTINLTLQTLTDNFEKALQLYSSVILTPHLNKKDFEREKRKVETKILQLRDEPDEIASSLFDQLVFRNDNPYAYQTLGYDKTIKNISMADVKNYYSSHFIPNNSALIIAGNISLNDLKNKLNKNLIGWKKKSFNQIEINSNNKNKTHFYIFDKKDSVQSEIRIGHISSKRNNKDYFSKHILNTILGGQFSSRINLNLREDKGYTYGAFSRFNYYKDGAYFFTSTSVGQENTANAVKEILNELSKITEGVTTEELAFAKSSIIRKFPSNFETYGQTTANLTSKAIFSLSDDYFDTYIDNIKSVEIDDVDKTAAESIFPENLVIVIVGDKSKILDSLKELNAGEISEVDLFGEMIN